MSEREEGDAGYPEAARGLIEEALAAEGMALERIAFYDIDLGGASPSGSVEVLIPVPEDWNGELDAWYADEEGGVTALDASRVEEDGKQYAAFATDHFSLYAVSCSVPYAGLMNLLEADGKTFAEAAEEYYGENGTMETAIVTVANQSDTSVKAGETITFQVDYTFKSAAYYNYGEHNEPLFDSYDDSAVILHLPEGLSVVEGAE